MYKKVFSGFILVTLQVLFSSTLFAQDVITEVNGETIEAKVLEVSEKEIRFKKKALPNGPIYVLPYQKVASIKFANGSTELFNSVSQPREPEPVEKKLTEQSVLENEKLKTFMIALSQDVGKTIAGQCAITKIDNVNTEIFWDKMFTNEPDNEIIYPIIVRWNKERNDYKKSWVRGRLIVDGKGAYKGWIFVEAGGTLIPGCATSISRR